MRTSVVKALAERPLHAPFLCATRPGCALALDERMLRAVPAAGLFFDVPPPLAFAPEAVIDGGIAVLCLRGPIEQHSSWYWQSYEDLAYHVECALADASVRVVVLKIDSPGGIAAGMSEAHKAIRRLQKIYGKRVVAYVDELACSAAYHVACACSEVWGPPAAHFGSVGVILCTVDESKALEDHGIRVRYVVSGKRKADLHPGAPVTDDALRVAQEKVNILADQFFRLVAKARGRSAPQLGTAAAVEALQAAVYVGKDAVRVGLADGIASWPRFLSLVRASLDAAS